MRQQDPPHGRAIGGVGSGQIGIEPNRLAAYAFRQQFHSAVAAARTQKYRLADLVAQRVHQRLRYRDQLRFAPSNPCRPCAQSLVNTVAVTIVALHIGARNKGRQQVERRAFGVAQFVDDRPQGHRALRPRQQFKDLQNSDSRLDLSWIVIHICEPYSCCRMNVPP